MPSRFAQIRVRLLLLVLALVIPAYVLVIVVSLQQRRLEKSRVRENAVAISRLAAANQEQFIRNARQLLATLTQFPFLVLTTNAPSVHVHLSNLMKLSPDYLNFGLIEVDGTLFSSGIESTGTVQLNDRSYFQRVVARKRFAIGDYQVGRISSQPALNFGYPVLDERGKLKRVLFASLKLSLLSDALAHIPLPPDAKLVVLDRSGNVVAQGPEPELWVGRSQTREPLLQWILGHQEGVVEMPGFDGLARLHAVTPINDGDSPALFVSVGFPLQASFARANRRLAQQCIGIGVAGVLLLAGAFYYSQRFFISPVQALVEAANRLAAGDTAARVPLPEGKGELSELAGAFNSMAERLAKRQADLERANAEITHINADLEQRVEQRTADLTALNQELESFSYSVSHDLRSPIRHIHGFAQMLAEHSGPQLNETGQRYLSMIDQAAKHMAALIDDLLTFARMGRQQTKRTRVDVAELVRSVIAQLAPEADSRTIEWTIGNLPVVSGDETMLRQVWTNLIGNALKYTRPRAAVRIEIGAEHSPTAGWVFFIRDNGVGFDPAFTHKLFGVFQRLHDSTEFDGTGIGLAIVRRVISRHGGKVWAEGKPDAGATFFFSLLDVADESHHSPNEAPSSR